MSSAHPAFAPVTSPLGSLVAENELRHFLKLARPEWSKPRRRGRSDIVRVLAKLKAVGVNDIDTLIRKVEKNTINEELYNKGMMPLSRAALDSIRKQKTFIQALESVDVPNIRQVGVFDPVAQMLSRKPLPSASGTRGRSSSSRREEGRRSFSQSLPVTSGGLAMAPFIPDLVPPGKPCLFPRLRGVGSTRPGRLSPIHAHATTDGFSNFAPAETGRSKSFSMADNLLGSTLGSSRDNKVTWSATLPAGQLDTDTEGGESMRISKRASTTPLLPEAGTSTRGSVLSRVPDSQHRVMPTPSMDEMLALQRAGQRILQTLEDRQGSAAKWSPKSSKTPLEQGEDMLLEQVALDERERLVRLVKSKSNPSDPFRGHIAQNIKLRLETANNDSTEGLAINQRCLNIRKQLAGMMNARKELASLRAKVHLLMEEPLLPKLILDSYGLFAELTDLREQ